MIRYVDYEEVGRILSMKIEDLYDLTLGELLDEYCILFNEECGYIYGITSFDLAEKMFDEYDIESYSEAMVVNNLLADELIINSNEDLIDYDKICRIMKNLGISKKDK